MMNNFKLDKHNKINALESLKDSFIKLVSEFDKTDHIDMNELKAIAEYPFSGCLREKTMMVTEWVGNMQEEIYQKQESRLNNQNKGFCLETTDNKLVKIVIGKDQDGYYVQTCDIQTHTYLSEGIASGLKMRSHAAAIANLYADIYGIQVIDWK